MAKVQVGILAAAYLAEPGLKPLNNNPMGYYYSLAEDEWLKTKEKRKEKMNYYISELKMVVRFISIEIIMFKNKVLSYFKK